MQGVTATVENYYRVLIGELPGGSRLPSERSVVRELGTSRSTVRLVMVKLVTEGLVVPVQGSGYYTRLES